MPLFSRKSVVCVSVCSPCVTLGLSMSAFEAILDCVKLSSFCVVRSLCSLARKSK
ncbi:hypothetical protein PF005_g5205 [Phytophthora fragariae]|uniref:Uncharacterized protein n=1 Tax=Phytophthora fragariae TaxID=53985 RepID=A0A6A4E9M5_9STRA|nr:hypothetical protein PF003_g10501 [Phytophthora fragariae]KAE8944695.1 hypothetical protein PF009_g5619 [Phytophthora fragariae]KAE9022959.1 hypothetical protein PF011_g4210 [Phytophthora fragariae]KAE9128088.1 hypothetical protein PF010_g4638 [Phytophthora fragariae]KAE9129249.1 hypothetical protein PF007_g4963 [Phytophthora fragariae]